MYHLQDEEGQVIGATVRDVLGRKAYDVYARQVFGEACSKLAHLPMRMLSQDKRAPCAARASRPTHACMHCHVLCRMPAGVQALLY